MAKCFILCNIENPKSNYIRFNFTGSNLSRFIGSTLGEKYDVVFLNVGAPNKGKKQTENIQTYSYEKYTIAEFKSGSVILPNRARAKLSIKNAVSYLIENVDKDDKVIIYHSLSFTKYYKKLQKTIPSQNLILLFAELYSDVGNVRFSKEKEVQFVRVFDKLIAMSNGLIKSISGDGYHPNHCFLYGIYNAYQHVDSFNPGIIHLVYAGTASPIKGGLSRSLAAMKHLPNNYKLHVFCDSDLDTQATIKETPNTIYEGFVNEEELIRKLCTYDIGLASQNPNLPFNESSFPSKIVTYLGCGLNVVSSMSSSVIDSPLNEFVTFYEEDESGENMAKSIIKSSELISHDKNIQKINELRIDFENSLVNLISK